jgi:hypothetical protein
LTGIQAADLVGRKVGFEKGATAFAVLDEMRKLDGDLARSKNANVAAARDNFMHAVGGVVVRSGQRRCERIGARRSAVLGATQGVR